MCDSEKVYIYSILTWVFIASTVCFMIATGVCCNEATKARKDVAGVVTAVRAAGYSVSPPSFLDNATGEYHKPNKDDYVEYPATRAVIHMLRKMRERK